MEVMVIGPRDRGAQLPEGTRLVDTTSRSREPWSLGLSPFHLGPVALPDGVVAKRFENAWQYSKLYAAHADEKGEPDARHQAWRLKGMASERAVRYPMGKGAVPLCSLWAGRRLDYAQAREAIYWPLYRDAVARTPAFATLKAIAERGPVALFDLDGYAGASSEQAFLDLRRPMGHAFVLKAMLERGERAEPRATDGAKRGLTGAEA